MFKFLGLALLCIIIICDVQCICNRTALSRVDIYASLLRSSKLMLYKSYDINNLNKYYSLDVINGNVTVLCEGMIKSFGRLEILSLINNNISEVESYAIQDVPKLHTLSLSSNKLTYVKRGQFSNIPTLKKLYLSNNEIEYIEENSFEAMPLLQKIYLAKNKIEEINGYWFLNSPQIRLVDLSFNLIDYVPEGAFKNLLPNHGDFVEYKLQHNKIYAIDKNAIDNEQPIALHLEYNLIGDVGAEVLVNLNNSYGLFLDNNQVNCLNDEALNMLPNVRVELSLKNNPLNCMCISEKFSRIAWKEYGDNNRFTYSAISDCKPYVI